MASRTLEDKVEELTKLAATHEQQLKTLHAQISLTGDQHSALDRMFRELEKSSAIVTEKINELKLVKESLVELKTENALLKEHVGQLKKWQDEEKKRQADWGQRLWLLVPPVVASVLSSFLTYLFTRK